MNLFNARMNELRDVSDRLLIELRIAVKGTVATREKDPRIYVRLLSAKRRGPVNVDREGTSPELRAIGRLIRGQILDQPFDTADIEVVAKALNEPVSRVWRKVSHDGEVAQYLAIEAQPMRLIAELLVQYLECFAREPRLAKHNPIAACPSCNALFVKTKSNQKCCSQPCYLAYWARHKLNDDPNYFADKAREYRNIRKKRAVKKAKRV